MVEFTPALEFTFSSQLFYKMKQVIISHKIKSMLIAENKHSDLKKDIISSITILNGNAALFESIYLCSHPA